MSETHLSGGYTADDSPALTLQKPRTQPPPPGDSRGIPYAVPGPCSPTSTHALNPPSGRCPLWHHRSPANEWSLPVPAHPCWSLPVPAPCSVTILYSLSHSLHRDRGPDHSTRVTTRIFVTTKLGSLGGVHGEPSPLQPSQSVWGLWPTPPCRFRPEVQDLDGTPQCPGRASGKPGDAEDEEDEDEDEDDDSLAGKSQDDPVSLTPEPQGTYEDEEDEEPPTALAVGFDHSRRWVPASGPTRGTQMSPRRLVVKPAENPHLSSQPGHLPPRAFLPQSQGPAHSPRMRTYT